MDRILGSAGLDPFLKETTFTTSEKILSILSIHV